MNSPGFMMMSNDAHQSLNLSSDAFVELAKMAMRSGLGAFVCLDPVKWKGYASFRCCSHAAPRVGAHRWLLVVATQRGIWIDG